MADRNASLLAAADAIMDKHSPRPEFSSAPDVTDARRVRFRDAIYDALASSSASGAERHPKVKVLPWRKHCNHDWLADTEIGQYAAGPTRSGYVAILRHVEDADIQDTTIVRGVVTPEAARAAAQADYEARILSALDVPASAFDLGVTPPSIASWGHPDHAAMDSFAGYKEFDDDA